MTRNSKIALVSGVVAVLGVGTVASIYQAQRANEAARARLTYQADGYGGFTPGNHTEGKGTPPLVAPTKAIPAPVATSSPVNRTPTTGIALARTAYAKGDYKAAETAAKEVVASAPKQGRASVAVASAQHLMAFVAARQGDLKTARQRFAEARKDAETLPKTASAPTAPPGEMPQPTLAEDSAYQHAACTMGLGDKAGAERELVQFMRDFPESPLVHGAMRRIAKLHGGDIPKEAEAVWKSAQSIQHKSQEKSERDAAMCAPECLAELLKRRGKGVSVETLAQEMKTGGDGTSAAKLQEVMQAHGFDDAQGVRLTWAGLKEQPLPLVALVSPGHFVLVDKIGSDDSVTIWDSSPLYPVPGTTAQKTVSTRQTLSATQWKQIWQGIALTTAKVETVSEKTL